MYCYHHPESPAVGVCVDCNNPVCSECKVEYQGRVFCNSCVQKKISAMDAGKTQQLSVPADGNTSGMGPKAAVPAGLGSWNWGGFLLTWIWGIGNNVWWSFLVFVPYLGALVMPWVLAFKGNEWAWQSKRWDSIEHFKRVQHTWAMWGLGITIGITVFICIIMVVIAIIVFSALQSGSKFRWY